MFLRFISVEGAGNVGIILFSNLVDGLGQLISNCFPVEQIYLYINEAQVLGPWCLHAWEAYLGCLSSQP